MSIENIRSSLNSDNLTIFDRTLSKYKSSDNVLDEIIDFTDASNFIVKSIFDTKPIYGFVIFKDGEIAGTCCC